jgi:hypothetical protein
MMQLWREENLSALSSHDALETFFGALEWQPIRYHSCQIDALARY